MAWKTYYSSQTKGENNYTMLAGIFFSITCAFTWSVSIILWKKIRTDINPLLINLGKNACGLCLFIATLLIRGTPSDIPFNTDFLILTISGFIGIGLADALVLKSIYFLPASRVALLETSYAPIVIVMSILILGESLGVMQLCGIILVLGAVVYIQLPNKQNGRNRQANLAKGAVFMLSGLILMSIGIILMKPLLNKFDIFWIITLRMASGVFGSMIVFSFLKNKRKLITAVFHSNQKSLILISFITSAYISILLWVVGFKYLDASLAAVLNQTTTIFTVLLAAIFLHERLEKSFIIATGVAIAGVMIIALG